MTNGTVLWITGFSAAGKSTIAREAVAGLRAHGIPAILLDGDDVRAAIADVAAGHDPGSRLTNAYRIARLARLLAIQKTVVVVATMSLFREIHDWNRRHLPGYFEVLLNADMDVRARRDPKGLYARAFAGDEHNVVSVDIVGDLPSAPDLAIANDGGLEDVASVTHRIVEGFLRQRR